MTFLLSTHKRYKASYRCNNSVRNTLISVLLLFSGPLIAEHSLWPCHYSSGKGLYPCNTFKQGLPLQHFKEKIVYCVNFEKFGETPMQPTQIQYIGKLHGRKIYDVYYPIHDKDLLYYDYYQLTILETDKEKYKPVYCLMNSKNMVIPAHSYIIPKKNILANEMIVRGSGALITSFYLFCPPDGSMPQFTSMPKNHIQKRRLSP